jgi:hypothetical protein
MVMTCRVCNQYQFKAEEVVFFQLRRGTIEHIDLGDREPWSGVNCVCRLCVEMLRKFTAPVPAAGLPPETLA